MNAAFVTRLLRGLAGLSLGTVVVQMSAAASQFLLAIWLSPDEFGYWAAATGALVVCSGLVNFGEVNGLLANRERRYRDAKRAAWCFNSILAALGLLIAGVYFASGRPTVSWLIALTALTIPITGASRLAYAVLMRPRAYRVAVAGQAAGAFARLAAGVLVAYWTGSAIAFVMSLACYSLVSWSVFAMASRYKALDVPETERKTDLTFGLPARAKWGVQALAQFVPNQVDYFVASLVASPGFLGAYFLAYQITAAISGLVIGPLSKSFLAALSPLSRQDRADASRSLQRIILCVVVLASACLILFSKLVQDVVPDRWADVVPMVALLAASLPARFIVPVTDAALLSDGRWSASIRLHAVDILGTSVAALVAFAENPALLASVMAGWKVVNALFRLIISSTGGLKAAAPVGGALALFSALLICASHFSGTTGAVLLVIASVGASLVLAFRPTKSGLFSF